GNEALGRVSRRPRAFCCSGTAFESKTFIAWAARSTVAFLSAHVRRNIRPRSRRSSWPASFAACRKASRHRKRNTPHSASLINWGGGRDPSGRRPAVSSVVFHPENPHAARL